MKQGELFTEHVEQPHDWKPSEPPSLAGVNELELDVETTGLKWWESDRPIGVAVRTPDGICRYLPFGHRVGGNLPEDTVKRWASRELRDKHIVGLNTKFDVHMLREWGCDLEEQGCTVTDVSHHAALLDDSRRRGFGLDDLANEHLGMGKVQGLDVTHLKDYHAGDVAPYAERDVELTGRLKEKFRPLLEDESLLPVMHLEDSVIFAVCEMERNGCPLDLDLLKKWKIESEQLYNRTAWDISETIGFSVNPNSSFDMERLFLNRGVEIEYFTEAGRPSFEDEVLAGITDEIVIKARGARKLASLRSKYILKYWETAKHDALLRFALHQLRADEGGTITGRFSSSAMKLNGEVVGANIQQVMTAEKQIEQGDKYVIRQLFVPKNGLFLSADAAQIEFRIFVELARSPKLMEEYAKDPHVSFHLIVWDMVKQFTQEIAYKQVKNLNFAKLYGAGVRKIAIMLGIDLDTAEKFIQLYDAAFPDARRMLQKASKLAESRGYVKTLLGRRSRFPARERLHKALNGVIQGTAGDIMKRKLVELHKERKRTGFVMRATIHDEVIGDAPDTESAQRVGEVLNRQTTESVVPILWEVKTGKNWAEAA